MADKEIEKKKEEELYAYLRREFVSSANELLMNYEVLIFELDQAANRAPLLARLYRIVFGLQKAATLIEFDKLSQFLLSLQDTLAVLRVNQRAISQEILSFLLSAKGQVQLMLSTIARDKKDANAWLNEDLKSSLEEIPASITARMKEKQQDTKQEKTEKAETTKKVTASKSKKTVKSSVLRVDSLKVDSVMEMLGELVVLKSLLMQDEAIQSVANQRVDSTLKLLDRTVRDLYDRTLAIRMTNVSPLFMKLEHTIKNLSVELGKPVQVTISGETTEIDRTITDKLGTSLIHIIRNAIDHGLEPANERLAKNKPKQGQVRLAASTHGGNIILEISDDGKGIDKQRVYEKAVSKGLIPETTKMEDLREDVIFGMIFERGFSTAQKVTHLSGRGVGLEAVKETIENMGGSLSVASQQGKFTRFTMTIPLSTSITDGMMVRVGSKRYILPIDIIAEFVSFDGIKLTSVAGKGEVIDLRDVYIPLLRLNKAFSRSDTDERGLIIIVQSPHLGRVGIVVDEVLGQSQVVLKSLKDSIGAPVGVAGAAILGDGRVGMVLDINSIFERVYAKKSVLEGVA